jgi:hypothetical protein
MIFRDSASGTCLPNIMVPRQKAETFKPVRPILRYSIPDLLSAAETCDTDLQIYYIIPLDLGIERLSSADFPLANRKTVL